MGVVVHNCISGVEIMNSDNIKVQIVEKVPSISVDKSNKVSIILNGDHKECDIVSSKANELSICYTISGDVSKAATVP